MTTNNDIEQLFRSNYRAMLTLGTRLLRDEDAARDIVHDVFAAILASGFSDASPAYLLRAVHNRCLNRLRDLSTAEQLRGRYATAVHNFDDDTWPDEETIARMLEIVDSLPDQCRRVVKLRFEDGKKYREIAEIACISEVMVYKHLRHALDVLRLKMKDYGQD